MEGAGGIVYEQSEVDHHRGSQAKAKEVMEGTIRREKGVGGFGQEQHSCIALDPPPPLFFCNRTLLSPQRGRHIRKREQLLLLFLFSGRVASVSSLSIPSTSELRSSQSR